MTIAHPSPRPFMPWQVLTRGLAGLFIAFLFAVFGPSAHAAAPPANATITNQASASYQDNNTANAPVRTVNSNQVVTTVSQVFSLTLSADGARSATPGSQVYFPHTVTNTGNGTDSFNLAAASAASPFQLDQDKIYLDDGSGQPTGNAITATPQIAAGTSFKFIVSAVVPTTGAGQINSMTVTATSVGDASKSATNTDKTTTTVNAVLTLNKSVDVNQGAPGSGPYTFTLSYTNNGNQDASDVVITDVLPKGMTYVAKSTTWSGTGVAIPDDGTAVGSPNTIAVTATTVNNVTTFKATISKVAVNGSGTVKFKVNIAAGTANGVLHNTAKVDYNNGSATPASTTSNMVDFTVAQVVDLLFTGDTVQTAVPGQIVKFVNRVTNNGSGTDIFNITFGTSTFPGNTAQLYRTDGTPLTTDADGNGQIDTGPLAPGASFDVVVWVQLPQDLFGNNGGNGWTLQKTATSKTDPSKSLTVTDKLVAIDAQSVDLAHTSAAAGDGIGPGPGTAVVKNLPVAPGGSAVFTLYVKNTGAAVDNYDLTASTQASQSSLSLPAGWTVEFKASVGGSCAAPGVTLTKTGDVNKGEFATVCAVVTVPAGYVAGQQDLYFRSTSPNSKVTDVLWDAVTVAAVRSISVTPNGAAQTYPGGSYVYKHVLKNNGNVPEAVTVNSTVVSDLTQTLANDGANWTATLYVSTNDTFGDADDKLVTAAGLNAFLATGLERGASVTLFVKVQAPQGATAGTINTTTLTITTSKGTYTTDAPAVVTATDATTIISGNLSLEKKQAKDTGCTGNLSGVTFTTSQLDAKPGECVVYQITVTNIGAADAFNVVVTDTAPTYTTLNLPVATTGGVAATGTAAGQVKVNIGTGATATAGGTLSSGQSATLTFGVKIDQ